MLRRSILSAIALVACAAILPAQTPVPAGAEAPRSGEARLDAAARARVIEAAIERLDEHYVFPDVAARMATAVREKLKRGEYDSLHAGPLFAQRLTADFRAVSNDKHLRVNFSPAQPGQTSNAGPSLAPANCGFVKTEIMPGNVGYLKFNVFANPDICAPTATAEMTKLAGVDALIIDLRENGGGSPGMVAHITSYLFSKRVHLNDLWTRRTNETREFWTRPEVPGPKVRDDVPVYVLTAKRTFSGAEEFSYNLKNLKRATIVGEVTGGGAHPVRAHRIDDHFVIGVPFARAINPYSKTNWEGTGVEPDVKVPAAEAMDAALKMIREKRLAP